MKILVADDDVSVCLRLEEILSRNGYEVVVACDGVQARQALEAEDSPRVAILDWLMPGVEGIDLCREVRKWPQDRYIYILMLTGLNRKADIIAGLNAGANDYLTKPFDEHELMARVNAGQRIADLNDQLLALATHDALTGLWNHSAISQFLGRELARGKRRGSSVGVILADLDHFKRINDTYGHLAGDAVLCEASHRMRDTLRTYDGIGRFGGEEFLIVAPECDRAGAADLAERLRKCMADKPVVIPEGRLNVTGSLGVVASAQARDADMEALFRAADRALYRAKNNGRNRVEVGTFGTPPQADKEGEKRP